MTTETLRALRSLRELGTTNVWIFLGMRRSGGWEAGETITTETLRARRNRSFNRTSRPCEDSRKTAFLRVLSVSVVKETRRHFDVAVEETRRHFDITAERLEKRFDLLAESVAHLDDELQRTRTSLDEKIDRTAAETQATIKFSTWRLTAA